MSTAQQAQIARRIAELDDMDVARLQEKWEEVWREPCRSRNKFHLRKRIAWRIQSLAFGGLSQRALERARELADETRLRTREPQMARAADVSAGTGVAIHRFSPSAPPDRLMPGAVLTREYRGRKLLVTVLEKGFEFDGQAYRSLTAVAKAVTGTHWNGRLFFGLAKTGKEAA